MLTLHEKVIVLKGFEELACEGLFGVDIVSYLYWQDLMSV